MKKIRSKSKKGFTLVELIVVLVILAILAAMLVPALTGYIQRARQEKDFQAASTVLTAVQSMATQAYATAATVNAPTAAEYQKVITLSDIEDLAGVANIHSLTGEAVDGIVTQLVVQFEDGGAYYAYKYGCTSWGSDTTSSANALAAVANPTTVTGTPVAFTAPESAATT